MRRTGSPTRADLMAVYERLLAAYGPRNWWPAESHFEMIAGAILTQNTAWRNVEKALASMRGAGLWSFAALHAVDADALAEAVRPSGYYRTKARKLKEFARIVVEEFGVDLNRLLGMETAALRARLLGIWGIGEETADCIVVYAAGKPSFVIDAYTMRIVHRLGWPVRGSKYAHYQAFFAERLPPDAALFNEYHALLDGHAVRTCQPRPQCGGCCLRDLCPTGNGDAA